MKNNLTFLVGGKLFPSATFFDKENVIRMQLYLLSYLLSTQFCYGAGNQLQQIVRPVEANIPAIWTLQMFPNPI